MVMFYLVGKMAGTSKNAIWEEQPAAAPDHNSSADHDSSPSIKEQQTDEEYIKLRVSSPPLFKHPHGFFPAPHTHISKFTNTTHI